MSTVVSLPDGGSVHVIDRGEGYPVIFQHGLGGDRNQVAEAFPDDTGFRRVTTECRGHGLSPNASPERYSIAGFADDLLAVADKLGIECFAVGGISMGAAIAMRLAVTCPERISALMLVRPAWMSEPAPWNMRPYVEAAQLMHRDGRDGRRMFAESPMGLDLAAKAPDNLASLLGFFDRDDLPGLADLLERVARDSPGVTEQQLKELKIPVLVVGNANDLVHPLDYARRLAAMIPAAHFAEITSKAVDKARYIAELRITLGAFLKRFAISKEAV
jgi:pimeloyl-ACP methyl ester carboxylesterase